MPTQIIDTLRHNAQYGPLPPGTAFSLRSGYSAILGQNDVGKSSLLQWVFLRMLAQGHARADRIALVLTDRFYVTPHTRTTMALEQFNEHLRGTVVDVPRDSGGSGGVRMEELFAALIQRSDFVSQLTRLNEYLERLGFTQLTLRSQQVAYVDSTPISAHGAGIRCLLPVLAALTSDDIRVVLIDEPELSLEARAQKVLRQVLTEAAANGKTIIVATQSHLFLNRKEDELSNNYLLNRRAGELRVDPVSTADELLDVTFNLLGNSLEDLFFPNNFLVVEGSSDQCIVERAATLLGIGSHSVKVIAARGIDKVISAYEAMTHTLVPLIASGSPYASTVVVLVDKPDSTKQNMVAEVQRVLDDRCFVLPSFSLEEYIPDELYAKAGRDKSADLNRIAELKTRHEFVSDGWKAVAALKSEISTQIAGALDIGDLDRIPLIAAALRRAAGAGSSSS